MTPEHFTRLDEPSELGHLERRGAHTKLVFTRTLAYPVDTVWRAVTEPQHRNAWFPDSVEGAFEPGAKLRFFSEEHDFEFDGEVFACEPPRLLEIRWGTDVLRFELHGENNTTVLTLTDTFEELGKAARDAAGWHECLDRLELEVAGRAPDFGPGQRWAVVHPRYVDAFGPEASSIGPPEGWKAE